MSPATQASITGVELMWKGQHLAVVQITVQSSGQQGNEIQVFGWEGMLLSRGAGRTLEAKRCPTPTLAPGDPGCCL